MTTSTFQALVATQESGRSRVALTAQTEADLPEGDVLVRVAYSSLNYKDGLALTGKGKVIRRFPLVPGIDLVGQVETSSAAEFAPGAWVIATGFGLGEQHGGGYSQKQRLSSRWLVPLPAGLSPRHAMTLGTAGFTAAIALAALEKQGLRADRGEVLVTGAGGGVGSVAVALLARSGYRVAASTGKNHDYLRALGASAVLDRDELARPAPRPLESERWAGVIDTVGGSTLASALTRVQRGGAVAACGLVGGSELNTTVIPFLLRGISLLGIDSNEYPIERRREAWERMAAALPPDLLDSVTTEISLEGLVPAAERILAGGVRGRTVVKLG